MGVTASSSRRDLLLWARGCFRAQLGQAHPSLHCHIGSFSLPPPRGVRVGEPLEVCGAQRTKLQLHVICCQWWVVEKQRAGYSAPLNVLGSSREKQHISFACSSLLSLPPRSRGSPTKHVSAQRSRWSRASASPPALNNDPQAMQLHVCGPAPRLQVNNVPA